MRHNFFRFAILWLNIVTTGLSAQELTQITQSSNQDTVSQSTPVPDQIAGQSLFIGLMKEYMQLNQSPPREKIYLHLDRPNYMQGDTIWFKAYSWCGYDQIPDTLSGVLYVDLINPLGRIVLKRKLLIQSGTSSGDLYLDTIFKPGRYMVRAYTRPMQNINTGEPFYQTITINPLNQNFQVECTPVILKQVGNDSLQVSYRFF